MCECVCVCVCVHACMRACVRVCECSTSLGSGAGGRLSISMTGASAVATGSVEKLLGISLCSELGGIRGRDFDGFGRTGGGGGLVGRGEEGAGEAGGWWLVGGVGGVEVWAVAAVSWGFGGTSGNERPWDGKDERSKLYIHVHVHVYRTSTYLYDTKIVRFKYTLLTHISFICALICHPNSGSYAQSIIIYI